MNELALDMRRFSRRPPPLAVARWYAYSPHPVIRECVRLFVRYAPGWL